MFILNLGRGRNCGKNTQFPGCAEAVAPPFKLRHNFCSSKCRMRRFIQLIWNSVLTKITRMHSSRMRTAHSLTVCRSICWGAYMARMPPCHACPPAMHGPPCHACPPPHHTCPHASPCHACCPPPRTPPPPCGQTDTCKNVTFANFVCRR